MKIKWNWVLLILVLVLSATILFLQFKKSKTAYIDLSKLYKEFTLKKELEAKLLVVQQQRTEILDSLELELKILAKQLDDGGAKEKLSIYNVKKETYLLKAKEFEEDNETLITQYDEQIWKQLNQYVKDYGSSKNYEYIFGVTGDGVLMYANEGNDITDKVKEYVNAKYQGE